MAAQSQTPQQVTIQTTDEMSRGRYSNSLLVAHGPEEFTLDWLLNAPNGTHLVARVTVAPGHMRRILATLADSMRKYEEQQLATAGNLPPSDQQKN